MTTAAKTRIILYSGKGGVGKTSLSAATAIRAARSASARSSSRPTPRTACATRSTASWAASRPR